MTTYQTGNPIGSADPRDLYDNAQVIDDYANSGDATTTDRLGVERATIAGIDAAARNAIANAGYEFVGDYAAGIELTAYNQVVRDTSGEFWRVSGSTALPYTTTGTGMSEGGAFVTVGDAALRQELALPVSGGNGALHVSGAVIYVDTIAELQSLDTSGLVDGQTIYLTQEGRAGEFVVKTGTPPSDPQKGIYIVLANGNYAMRIFDGVADKGAIYASWFGATGDGITDDTTAINAALNHAGLRKVKVKLSSATYLYGGGGVLAGGVTLEGAGRNSTTILARDASAPYLFNASGYGSGFRALRFEAGVTQTSGKWVWLSGKETFIDDFFMTGDFNGIHMTGNVSRIRHGRFQDGASGAIRIIAEGGDNSQIIDDVLMGAQSPQVSAAGIRVRNSSALMITNTSVIQQTIGLLIDPRSSVPGTPTSNTDSGNVFSLFVDNCFFDKSGDDGIVIRPTNDARVERCRFSNCWSSSSRDSGILIENAGTGVIKGMHFDSLHCILNGGSGINFGVGPIEDITITGGGFSSNTYGIYASTTLSGLTINGAVIGESLGVSGNQTGLILGAGCQNIVITGNRIIGNTVAFVDDSSPWTAEKVIDDNIGYYTKNSGVETILSGSTSVTVNHGLPSTPQLENIKLSRTTGNAGSVDLYVSAITSSTFTISTGPAPTSDIGVSWSANL